MGSESGSPTPGGVAIRTLEHEAPTAASETEILMTRPIIQPLLEKQSREAEYDRLAGVGPGWGQISAAMTLSPLRSPATKPAPVKPNTRDPG